MPRIMSEKCNCTHRICGGARVEEVEVVLPRNLDQVRAQPLR